jgi:hypothetical protein
MAGPLGVLHEAAAGGGELLVRGGACRVTCKSLACQMAAAVDGPQPLMKLPAKHSSVWPDLPLLSAYTDAMTAYTMAVSFGPWPG